MSTQERTELDRRGHAHKFWWGRVLLRLDHTRGRSCCDCGDASR